MKEKNYKIVSLYSFFPFKEKFILELKDELLKIENKNDFSGLLIFASEGINGTICAGDKVIEIVMNLFKKYINIRNLNIKVSYSEKKVFKKLKIKIKKEIVTMGVPKINPSKDTGTHINATEWNKLIEEKNTIIIDTRNHYEVSIGTFQNSINPKTNNFSEFPKWVDDHLESHLENKDSTNIAMFCTGGIRCEKATSLLKKKGYKNIFHLQGGILQYLKDISEKENLFEGECFVFDKRVALDRELEKGSYSICHACGMPVSIQDQKRNEYRKGIQCHFCINKFSDDDRKRFEERQKQIDKIKAGNKKNLSRLISQNHES
ncbi:rhodanese-related sulfurtransferase [uncultured Prochlorococcus sp.]|uniref:oxygen-dependent tRNA uridine(34) hydroxylase TrhO n=1 Tax=uncultured Prochlorococcus sp. TaxID=159733 RepID=UPI00258861DF|nr:rhodanese-related sulfurtransferase [uncultured Prochlorococcus sp.]